MAQDNQQDRAEALRAWHAEGTFVLPNAWDPISAAVIAQAGAVAIATTSAAVSWALGRTDGQRLSRDEAAGQVARIAAAVDVPVTADIEGGYGPTPQDVAATVSAVIAAGAVGINLEDSTAPGGPLFEPGDQAARLRAARDAAAAAGLPALVINARTDVYLFGIGEPAGRFDDVLARAAAYAEAGADSLFVPGLLDLDTLADLVGKSPLPVNVMVGPGAPAVPELAAIGVRRVSLGPALAQAAYGQAAAAARELLGAGTYTALDGALDFGAVEALLR
ncbi:isocitrate lyase/phosphoenolpyruvate mutase family protein [Nocardia puris]|uniref:2-methylisocitrate lyase-like PEP mutase family enzyme n=1 Tax=Nocardia puris TaxID=208602 RepID=A0A366E451_9NOCA|nr:isocitrate lyase/phosphoenolpyruvate mutase family protein [Nocardia puris]MBF6209454.1 isocitrate lyase/phosphoenolpyruvate mutase family protein [Nocardia puris]MBF6367820.1 isocitrate lyase/phosphoenolpyruvate mutase family protein [Nocardia puris]MBF6461472.1 isocitrate lyase/phosphoenolpyruvate mutase family protein [Nocardia puris]RBO96284.1 2-methylisocitrate lyase-like PEP mutase family enzyme [Nocardia puris]